jgi:hypothetical protein
MPAKGAKIISCKIGDLVTFKDPGKPPSPLGIFGWRKPRSKVPPTTPEAGTGLHQIFRVTSSDTKGIITAIDSTKAQSIQVLILGDKMGQWWFYRKNIKVFSAL